MSRLPYLRREELDPSGQDVWDNVVGTRGAALVNEQGGLAGPFNAFVHAPEVGRHPACFLPLSENTIAVGRHVGTRHRAAVGLSEQTDAVVVVVSEESGLVSVARAGRLSVPIDDEERLRRVLAACIRPTRRSTRPRAASLPIC